MTHTQYSSTNSERFNWTRCGLRSLLHQCTLLSYQRQSWHGCFRPISHDVIPHTFTFADYYIRISHSASFQWFDILLIFVQVDEVQGQIVYSNTVRSAATTDIITTQESLTINVDCAFDQDNIVSSSAVVQGSVSEDLEGNGQFEMVFAAYAESDYSNEITGDDRVNTNDLIYLRAEVIYVRRVDLFPIRCYATPEPSSSYFRFADLIDEGWGI